MTPEHVRGLAALFLLAAAFFLKLRRQKDRADVVSSASGAH